ncbi:hypothetical protein ABT297_39100 [Dactylosporangium sp. NPDC000555]|uniref:hypothetical protein n=1 Tax=Dactylosporangium sp. NPDC000555 TaxID=3154260 RepID=UPI003322CDE0
MGELPDADSMVHVDDQGAPVMRPATFRLPPSMLEWLEQAAGRDREGKSGIVRRALQEYRERHHEHASFGVGGVGIPAHHDRRWRSAGGQDLA